MQPLAREILRHGVRARVGQHPPGLFFKDRGFVEAVAGRQIDQRVIRNAAPEEKRQPRGEFDIADSSTVAVPRLGLGTEHERRTCQQAPQRQLNAGFKRALLAAFFIERKQKVQIGRRHRPPVRTLRERGENPPGAGLFLPWVVGPANEDALAAWRVSRAARQERSEHGQGFDVGPARGCRRCRHCCGRRDAGDSCLRRSSARTWRPLRADRPEWGHARAAARR